MNRFWPTVLGLACLAFSMTALAGDTPPVFFISPSGSDSALGTQAAPFRSLERVRDAIRALKEGQDPFRGATVFLRRGVYVLERTLELDARDSGAPNARIVFKPWRHEPVEIVGGRSIRQFGPVTDPQVAARFNEAYRERVLEADLRAEGITDLGKIREQGPAPLELFFQGRPMQLARWPNPTSASKGWFTIAGVPEEGDGDRFIYVGGRPQLKRWSQSEAWLHGYWIYDWWDRRVKIKKIDPENALIIGEVSFVRAQMANQTSGKKVNRNFSSVGRRYYAFNILDELDEPGEYFVDHQAGKLYFWPPAPIPGGNAAVSLLEGPMIALREVSHVTFQHLTLEYSRSNGVEIVGGQDNLIAGSTLRNVGGNAVVIQGGSSHGVLGCDIYETGDGGVVVTGGDKVTLTPGGHYVRNNDIHHFGRWNRTYRPAVNLKGVGSTAAHNRIHDAPHAGVLLDGNDHLLEFNEFYNLCQETDDCGAFYANGLNRTARGNILRYNLFHDIWGIGGKSLTPAVYLDDFMSSTLVFGNVFYDTFGVKIGGGRNNTIENNIFAECDPAVHLDGRGLTWASGSFADPGAIQKELDAVNYTQPPYSSRYPELLTLLDENPAAPKGNRIVQNIFYGGRGWITLYDEVDPKWTHIDQNLKGPDPCFVDPARRDYRLRKNSPAHDFGFKPIPFEKIGIYRDEHRRNR
jgi:Right handed beta helix region